MGAGLELRSAWALRAKTRLRVGIPYAQTTVAPDPAHAAVWVPFFFGYPTIAAGAALALDDLTTASAAEVSIGAAASIALDDLTASAVASVLARAGADVALDALVTAGGLVVTVNAGAALALDDVAGAASASVLVAGGLAIALDELVSAAAASTVCGASFAAALDDVTAAAVVVLGAAPPVVPVRDRVFVLPGTLPPGVWGAPDLKGLPWRRLRGDEWTTPETRAVILAWIRRLVAEDPAIRTWAVEELRSGYSSTPDARMIIAVTNRAGARLEVGFNVGENDMTPEGIVYLLAEARKTLRFTR